MSHSATNMAGACRIVGSPDSAKIGASVSALPTPRQCGGRLFVPGVGGGTANCRHVDSARKLCRIQAFAATHDIPELTARINDEKWESVYSGWLVPSDAGIYVAPHTVAFQSAGGHRIAPPSALPKVSTTWESATKLRQDPAL